MRELCNSDGKSAAAAAAACDGEMGTVRPNEWASMAGGYSKVAIHSFIGSSFPPPNSLYTACCYVNIYRNSFVLNTSADVIGTR